MLVFWGSWCGPCLREIPHERELAERHRDRPFGLLGINGRDTEENARAAIAANGITWPNMLDGDEGPIVERYHVRGYPTTFVIDAKGVIRANEGFGSALDQLIDKLLAEAEVPTAEEEAPAP